MIGVILWSDAKDGKAVVWCEDQGDLAFLGSDATQSGQPDYFTAGDILEFEIEIGENLRQVKNPKHVGSQEPFDVSNGLRHRAMSDERATGKIIAFPSPIAKSVPSDIRKEIAI